MKITQNRQDEYNKKLGDLGAYETVSSFPSQSLQAYGSTTYGKFNTLETKEA